MTAILYDLNMKYIMDLDCPHGCPEVMSVPAKHLGRTGAYVTFQRLDMRGNSGDRVGYIERVTPVVN